MEEATLNVTGMSCNHCVNTIENRLRETEGVNRITVHLNKDSAHVIFDPEKTGLEKIKEIIKEQGYQAV